ncbi:MAG TPA: LiaF domain-containing protein [Acidimicrobiia bacterium]|nr:LiaF domain-containing protein [Acidimicrobiia bacterium]
MNAGRILFGSVVTAFGVIFLLGSVGVLSPGEVIGAWWPLAIVLLGVLHAGSGGRLSGGSLALVIVGAALLGVTTGLFGSDAWRYVWPGALIGIGLWLTLGWGRRLGIRPADDEEVDGIAVLGSARLATRSQRFRKASLTGVLGGVTLDLNEALPIPGGAAVSVTSILASVSILVPRGWVVEIRGLPLLGGWDDTTDHHVAGPGSPRLEVQALVVLGGLEVKHSGRWR